MCKPFAGIDTVKFYFPPDSFDFGRLHKELKQFENFNQYKQMAMFKNLTISTNWTFKTATIRGSLPKFVHGQNLLPMPFVDIAPTFETLNKAFQGYDLDFYGANVTGLHINSTFSTNNTVNEYPVFFKNLKGYTRLPEKYESTLKYFRKDAQKNSVTRELILYDKIAEMQKNSVVPPQYLGDKIARLEWQVNGNLRQEFKTGQAVTGQLLSNNSLFFNSIVDRFEKLYNQIEKRAIDKPKIDFNMTPKKVKDTLAAAYLVQNCDLQEVLEQIERITDKKEKYRMKQLVNELLNNAESVGVKSNLLAEFGAKFKSSLTAAKVQNTYTN